jgi:hypothetical protein
MPSGKPTPDSPASETRAMRQGNEALAPDQESLDQHQDDPVRGLGGVHHPERPDARSLPGTPGRAAGAPGDAEPERGIEAPGSGGGLAPEEPGRGPRR